MKKEGIEGDRLSRENRQQIDLFFNQFLPKGKKKVIRENIEGAVTGSAPKPCREKRQIRRPGSRHYGLYV